LGGGKEWEKASKIWVGSSKKKEKGGLRTRHTGRSPSATTSDKGKKEQKSLSRDVAVSLTRLDGKKESQDHSRNKWSPNLFRTKGGEKRKKKRPKTFTLSGKGGNKGKKGNGGRKHKKTSSLKKTPSTQKQSERTTWIGLKSKKTLGEG